MNTAETSDERTLILSEIKELLTPVIRQVFHEFQQKRFLLLLNDHSNHEAIAVSDISWITVKDDVLEFHAPALNKKTLHHHGSLQQIEKMLHGAGFVRVNKNTLINRNHVIDINCRHKEIVLQCGMTIYYTDTYYPAIREALFLFWNTTGL